MGEQRQETGSPAWTVDEMRKGSGSWSLASDAGMLQHLQEYSQKMISRTHDIQKQVTAVLNEAKLTSVRVNNTFNDFIMLANTQFVENRVYDDDVTQEPSEEEATAKKEKTKEEREAELVPKVSMAMKLGLGVIDSAFEKLDMNEANSEDSEDEEGGYKGEALLEAKDPYLSRPLPYMIGSPSFMQDDDVGLIDFPSEDEEEPPPEEESESESESESDVESPGPTAQVRRKLSDSDEYSEGSDLFHGEDSEDDLDVHPSNKLKGDSEEEEGTDAPRDFASELAAKITAAPVAPPESSKEKQGSTKKKKDKHKKQGSQPPDDGDLFAPPTRSVDVTEEDEDSPFGRGGGLFSSSKGGGLFDDEDDLFSEVTAPPKKKPAATVKEESSSSEDETETPPTKPISKQKQKPTGGVSMFGGENQDDLFSMPSGQRSSPQAATPQQAKKALPSTRAPGGLFDNSEDEEDDFFAAVSKSTKVKDTLPSKPAEKSLSKGLFDDEEGDLFADESPPKPTAAPIKPQEAKPDKKLPPGAVSMFGDNKNPLLDALKSKQKPEPPSSEDDQMAWSDEDKKSSQSAASKSSASFKSANQVVANKSSTNQISGTKQRSGSASSNSLFADDGDDLFESSAGKASQKPTAIGGLASNGPSRMFDEEEEEDDLFKINTKPKPSVEKSIKQSALFDEDEEEEVDIFAREPPPLTQQPSKKKPVGGVSLFGGADLFGDSLPKSPESDTKPQTSKEHTKTQTPPVTKKADSIPQKTDSVVTKGTEKGPGTKKPSGLPLFDDKNNKEEEDDIFAPVTTTTKPSTKKPAGPLFEAEPDEPEGSGVSVERKPPVDVKPKAKEKPVPKAHSEPQGAAKVGATPKVQLGRDLFNDSSDEDLFGESSQPKPVQPVKPKPAGKPAVKPPTEPPVVQKVGGVTTKSSTTDIFNDSGEEDLFGDSHKPTTVIPEPVKPKKPAGAVSMFGGVDPSALLRKKTGETKQEDSAAPDRVTTTDPLGSVTSANKTPPPVRPKGPGPVPGAKVQGSGVQSLQSRLAINPSSLLPGATPPVQEVPDVGVGFDDPPQSQTLHSVAKDRVKLRTGIRPPTRQARKSRADQSGPEYSNTASPASQYAAVADTTDASGSRVAFPDPASGLSGDPLMHRDEPPSQRDIGVFMGTSQKTHASITAKDQDKSTAKKKTELFGSDIDGEGDIFATGAGKKTTEDVVPEFTHAKDVGNITQTTTHNDDVADAVQESTQNGDVSTTEKVQSWLEHSEPVTKPSSKSVFEEGDEDIFANNTSKPLTSGDSAKPVNQGTGSVRSDRSATVSSHHSTLSSKSSEHKKVVDVEERARDSPDLVKPPKTDMLESSKPDTGSRPVIEGDILVNPKSKQKTKAAVLDNEDDLFTSSKLSSKPKAPLKTDDDDDLFSSSKLSATSKPVATVDDDIFATNVPTKKKMEDDDIFADIMKPSQPSKVVTKVDDDIFGETNGPTKATKTKVTRPEVDDIFADLGSQPVGQKEPGGDTPTAAKTAKKSKKSKKAIVKDEDIFKDDTDIFADIPAAKPKQPKAKKSKPQGKPLFGGETDDIFADTSSVAKPKKTKKSQKSSAAAGAAAAAFDKDAPNIFDDPLSALDS